MYNKYLNFKLLKRNDLVELSADEICVLENKEDDFIFQSKKPDCLMGIVNKKLSLFNLNKYYICTLNVSSPDRLTDHKKIWKLAGFEKPGIYDGSYNCEKERIYFGIFKDFLPGFTNDQVNIILLYLATGIEGYFDKIVYALEKNGFRSYQEKQSLIDTLNCLQKAVDHSIVVYEFPKQAKVYVLGQGVENKFSYNDLPKGEITEKQRV